MSQALLPTVEEESPALEAVGRVRRAAAPWAADEAIEERPLPHARWGPRLPEQALAQHDRTILRWPTKVEVPKVIVERYQAVRALHRLSPKICPPRQFLHLEGERRHLARAANTLTGERTDFTTLGLSV